MKKLLVFITFLLAYQTVYCWGFYAHRQINYHAVFLLPPQMIVFYKKHIEYLSEHAVAPDMRRYAIADEGPRHFIDIDHYGTYPYENLPRYWNDAVEKFSEDSLIKHGIVPWWLQRMQRRLTEAFKEKNTNRILKLSAELGHYMADAHVPLHATSNYNGQQTNQHGIHGFWESRAPELLAEKEWDFFIGKATYITKPGDFIWERVLESAAAADSVLLYEKILSDNFPTDQKFSFENRNGKNIRQYSTAFTKAYDKMLNGMIERRMRQSIYAIASLWYTAWVDAGQPDLSKLTNLKLSEEEINEIENLKQLWQKNIIKGREHE
ncbi:MAG: zinc dependent phospholipase C family protein [Chitinophagaceae bacterium]